MLGTFESTTNTGIGIIDANTAPVQLAGKGESGLSYYKNLFGETTLVAYSPFEFGGQTWAMLSKVNQNEAFAGLNKMSAALIKSSLALIVLTTGISLLIGGFFAKGLIRPINSIANRMRDIAEGEGDLTHRLPTSSDELGQLARYFNQFVEKVQSMLIDVHTTISSLRNHSEQVSQISESSNRNISDQTTQSNEIATAITEMAASISEVANNAVSAAQGTHDSLNYANNANTQFGNSLAEINASKSSLADTANVVHQLEEGSRNISGVLDVIRGIAEQTNLLALNAAIEAARAGEQGRGFAVVADEVRTLASRTQDSTTEIEEMINQLQNSASKAVNQISANINQADRSVKEGEQAGDSITQSLTTTQQINNTITQVASATEEQAKVADEIHANITAISQLGETVNNDFGTLSALIQKLALLSINLEKNVNRFKVR